MRIHRITWVLMMLGVLSCKSTTEPEKLVCNTQFDAQAFPVATVSFKNDLLPLVSG